MTTIEVAQSDSLRWLIRRRSEQPTEAFKSWHERKRADAIQECVAKLWDEWIRLVNRGREPGATT